MAKIFSHSPCESLFWTHFAAHCFFFHGVVAGALLRKIGGRKDFKKEAGRSLLLGKGGMGFAVGRSTRSLCRRGDERESLQISGWGNLKLQENCVTVSRSRHGGDCRREQTGLM